jgi:hypothetical protein
MKKRIKPKKVETTYAFYCLLNDAIFELKADTAHYLATMMLTHAYKFNVTILFLGEI